MKTNTAWGKAVVLEKVSVTQHAGEKSFASVIELLETAEGELCVRFAYTTEGITRRGPVTMRAADLSKLRKGLTKAKRLREALGGVF